MKAGDLKIGRYYLTHKGEVLQLCYRNENYPDGWNMSNGTTYDSKHIIREATPNEAAPLAAKHMNDDALIRDFIAWGGMDDTTREE